LITNPDRRVGLAAQRDGQRALGAAEAVEAALARREVRRPAIPWVDLVVYEANVRGFTMRHPDLSAAERGPARTE
jgi:glycogen operon protein